VLLYGRSGVTLLLDPKLSFPLGVTPFPVRVLLYGRSGVTLLLYPIGTVGTAAVAATPPMPAAA
jgi:hypothetical protein